MSEYPEDDFDAAELAQAQEFDDDLDALRQLDEDEDQDDRPKLPSGPAKRPAADISGHSGGGSSASDESSGPPASYAMQQFLTADTATPGEAALCDFFQQENARHFHTAPPRQQQSIEVTDSNSGGGGGGGATSTSTRHQVNTITLTDGCRYHLAAPCRVPTGHLRAGSAATSAVGASASGPSLRERLNALVDNEAAKRAAAARETVDSGEAVHINRFEELWVNKYEPKDFTELLSDERSNREVLKWVKLWGNVSARQPPAAAGDPGASRSENAHTLFHGATERRAQQEKQQRRQQQQPRQQQPGGKFGSHQKRKWVNKFEHAPPKVVLLCGPPGMGKTTLAHIVARQAGYHPFEINASDNRSASTLIASIEAATEMQSVFGDRRPNLVILDEIDGALGGGDGRNAITGLLKLINSAGAGRSGRTKRPIICICNDQFAPVLKPLRQLARVFEFKQARTSQLVARLQYICKCEQLRIATSTLNKLASMTRNDIRACLNTLQFLKKTYRNNRKYVGGLVISDDMLMQQGNQRDLTAPLFTAWRNVFFGPAKKATGGGGAAGGPNNLLPAHGGLASDWARPSAVPLGDVGIFTDGLFENFFEVPLPDATMSKTAAVLDTFSDCVAVQHTALAQSKFQLLRYAQALPISLAALYRQVVHHGRKAVRFPFTAVEVAQTSKKRQVLLRALWTGMQFQTRPASIQALAVDCISFILRICSPPLDVVSGQMQHVSPQERKVLTHLVDLWDTLGVTVKRASADNKAGSVGPAATAAAGGDFILDPPIDDLVYFAPEDRADKAVNPLLRLGPAAKAVLTAQLAQRHLLDGAGGEGFTRHTRTKTAEEREGGVAAAAPGAYVPSDRWKVCLEDPSKAAELAPADKRKLDATTAAGRKASRNGGAFLRGAGAANMKRRRTNRGVNKSAVVFKFKAGFTNAVRRPVMLADLL